jgi:1-acyl-sn-glycerol-3-phosphate acyltransferase
MKALTKNQYQTPEGKAGFWGRLFPGLVFYLKMASIVLSSAHLAKKGKYTSEAWVEKSIGIIRALEAVGVRIEIDNLSAFNHLKSPCVFVGNHMSTLETFTLPGLIQPFLDVTFIVKEELINYPVFKHVMISRDPIVVGRVNAREDLKAVLEGGVERLRRGISLVIFPQRTRRLVFNPDRFNTIGVKLAKRAGVPMVPFAVRTDAWGNGKIIKDIGKIDPSKTVHIHFGEPIYIRGKGKEEHEAVIQFISEKMKVWFHE